MRVVLQTNQVPIAELERNKSAKDSVRVRDDDEWHVADWNPVHGYPVLARGYHGWSPTVAEVAAALTTGRANGAGGCSCSSGDISITVSGDGVTNLTITDAIIGGIIIIIGSTR